MRNKAEKIATFEFKVYKNKAPPMYICMWQTKVGEEGEGTKKNGRKVRKKALIVVVSALYCVSKWVHE